MSSQIQITDYDPLWPEVFRREANRIKTLLGYRDLCLSTSKQNVLCASEGAIFVIRFSLTSKVEASIF